MAAITIFDAKASPGRRCDASFITRADPEYAVKCRAIGQRDKRSSLLGLKLIGNEVAIVNLEGDRRAGRHGGGAGGCGRRFQPRELPPARFSLKVRSLQFLIIGFAADFHFLANQRLEVGIFRVRVDEAIAKLVTVRPHGNTHLRFGMKLQRPGENPLLPV